MTFEGTYEEGALRKHGWENTEEWPDHPCLLAQLLFLFVDEDSSLKG